MNFQYQTYKKLLVEAGETKKFVRSRVVAYNVAGGNLAIIFAISCKDGKWKVGRGLGVSKFKPLKSAIKAAFSVVLGRRKTDELENKF